MGELKIIKSRPTVLEYTRTREAILGDYKGTVYLMQCSECRTLTTVQNVYEGSEPRTAIILCALCELNRKLKSL